MDSYSNFFTKTNSVTKEQRLTVDANKVEPLTMVDLEIEDLSDENEDNSTLRVTNASFSKLRLSAKRPSLTGSSPLTLEEAIKLKQLTLGSAKLIYTPEWSHQYFEFNKKVEYGLTQKKGGPCGVLASVQSYIFLEMFFKEKSLEGSPSKCLYKALADILWKIGKNTSATLAVEKSTSMIHPTSEFKHDGITERITYLIIEKYDVLLETVERTFSANPLSLSCVAFLYSCILTRCLREITDDFDVQATTLIGDHGYCNQEMVNLMISGKASSNVFDNEIQCDEMVLKGISRPSEIGFVSLYEPYKACKVGSYYKNPTYPIWLVLSESHFSVIFSKEPIGKNYTSYFNLHYYDGLALQDHEIMLSVYLESFSNDEFDEESKPSDHSPPIELCIKTKWPNAVISWNGSPPIM